MNRIDIEECNDMDELKEMAIKQYRTLFFISETLVDVSKWHITAEEGIRQIRWRLQQNNI